MGIIFSCATCTSNNRICLVDKHQQCSSRPLKVDQEQEIRSVTWGGEHEGLLLQQLCLLTLSELESYWRIVSRRSNLTTLLNMLKLDWGWEGKVGGKNQTCQEALQESKCKLTETDKEMRLIRVWRHVEGGTKGVCQWLDEGCRQREKSRMTSRFGHSHQKNGAGKTVKEKTMRGEKSDDSKEEGGSFAKTEVKRSPCR